MSENFGFWDLVKAYSEYSSQVNEQKMKQSYEIFSKFLRFCYEQNLVEVNNIKEILNRLNYTYYTRIIKENRNEISLEAKDYFLLYKNCFLDKVFSNCKGNALWNSFLDYIKNENLVKENITIENFCKRCGATVNLGQINYEEYLKVTRNPRYICHQCEQWLKILKDFSDEYDWNPDWNSVIEDLKQLSLIPGQQADPSKLLSILQKHGIVMSTEIIGFWNSLFDKYHGDGIIKCYAVADDFQGMAEQNFKRLLGGIFGSDNIR